MTCMLSNQSAMKVEINSKKQQKLYKIWRLSNTLLNNQQITEQSKENIRQL